MDIYVPKVRPDHRRKNTDAARKTALHATRAETGTVLDGVARGVAVGIAGVTGSAGTTVSGATVPGTGVSGGRPRVTATVM